MAISLCFPWSPSAKNISANDVLGAQSRALVAPERAIYEDHNLGTVFHISKLVQTGETPENSTKLIISQGNQRSNPSDWTEEPENFRTLSAMEGITGDGGSSAGLARWRNDFSRRFQYYLDKSTPHPVGRWLGSLAAATVYILRVYYVQGFYIVSYGLGIYVLNLLIGFLSPQVDPELEGTDGASLPTKGSDEFKPFIRRLPEFKFWYSITKAFCIAFVMTFFSVFDVPVFWPILLCYWVVLFVLTMKRQILHMVKYKYVPFSIGKQRYTGKRSTDKAGSSRD